MGAISHGFEVVIIDESLSKREFWAHGVQAKVNTGSKAAKILRLWRIFPGFARLSLSIPKVSREATSPAADTQMHLVGSSESLKGFPTSSWIGV